MMMIDHSSSFPFFHVDISKKHEDHCKELKSVSSSPARSYINSSNSHVKDVRGGNLDNNPPSESYITKASEISDGGAR